MSATQNEFVFNVLDPEDIDTIPLQPEISTAKSSPFIPKTLSVDYTTPTNVTNNIKENLKSPLPLNLLLTTSNNTTLSLHLSELIELNSAGNTPNTPKSVRFKFDDKHNNDYNIGDLVIISKTKQGLIRYIGELSGDAHIWYGIELIGGHKGYHDGTFQGERYFTCGSRQGLFIKKHQIVRKMTTTDFNNGKSKPEQKRKRHRKSSSLAHIRKSGPRDIGRITSTDWTPIEDADKIIAEENSKKFLDPALRGRRRKRPKTARKSAFRSERSQSTIPTDRRASVKSKVRINKDSALLPSVFTIRSRTPNPSRHGLVGDTDDNDTPKTTKKDTTKGRGLSRTPRTTSQRKLNKGKKKKKKTRGRSQTETISKSSLTKSRSAETTTSKWARSVNLGFPDISALTFRGKGKKKNKRHNKHIQSKSQGNYNKDKRKPLVIIRVSSGDDKSKGLDMSETTTIPMDDSKYDEDTLFAEVNAEIEERKSGMMTLEQQLDALATEGFAEEFEQNLSVAKVNQTQFTKRNSALIDALEDDVEDNKDGISSTKIKTMLWKDIDDDDDGDGSGTGSI